MKGVGALLLSLGIFFIIITFIFTIIGIITMDNDFKIDKNDFTLEGEVYRAYYSGNDLQSQIRVKISETSPGVQIIFIVYGTDDSQEFFYEGTLPLDQEFSLDSTEDGEILFQIQFISEHTIDNITIEIIGSEYSNSYYVFCCFSLLLGPGGLLLMISGLIVILVSFGKIKNSKVTDEVGLTQKKAEVKLSGHPNIPSKPKVEPQPQKQIRAYQQPIKPKSYVNNATNEKTIPVQTVIPLRKDNFLCPHCNTYVSLETRSKVSDAGWIVFVLLLIFFWPLFWVGLLMKEKYMVCSKCNKRINKNQLEEGRKISSMRSIPQKNKLTMAQNYEKAERLEDAAKLYEELELWEEAGRCRRKMKGSTIKHVHVDANDLFDQIKTKGIAIPYRCPNCSGTLNIDQGNVGIKMCPYCGTSINFETLQKTLDRLFY